MYMYIYIYIQSTYAHMYTHTSRGQTACPTRVQRGFCSSIGLHRISLVRASEETFRTGVFNAFEVSRNGCLLGEHVRQTAPVLRRQAAERPGGEEPDGERGGLIITIIIIIMTIIIIIIVVIVLVLI